jgi:2-dehydro-3-deoxygluconokinase
MQGGVATDFIRWREDDGIGRTVRNGLNFTERGFGVRGAVGVPDRGNTAASQLKPGDFDWDDIFGKLGVRWFHTGGIFAALSESTAALTLEAVKAARKHGTIVSYDLNYRPSLWKTIGGLKKAQEVNREIAGHVDVMIGNEEDFTASLGFEVEGADEKLSHIEAGAFKAMIETAVGSSPTSRSRHDAAPRDHRDPERLERHPLARRQVPREPQVPGARDPRPGRRRRQLRERPHLRVPGIQRPPGRRRLRRRPRRAGLDDPGDTSMATRRRSRNLMKGGGARVVRLPGF